MVLNDGIDLQRISLVALVHVFLVLHVENGLALVDERVVVNL